MPAATVLARAARIGTFLSDWVLDRTSGGPLASHAHAEVRAFAGAGKTFQIVRALRRAIQRGMRILVVANTNDQVRDIARRSADPRFRIVHFAADGEQILNAPPGLLSTHDPSALLGAHCVICTVYQAGKAAESRPGAIGAFDVGFIDEAYQVRTSSEALWALRLAPRWAFIGDPGQLEVFTTLNKSPFIGVDDPVTSIVDSARAQGADLGELIFDWTWRLPATGVAPLTALYGRPIRAVAEPTDRQLVLAPTPAVRGLARSASICVQRAATSGWGFLELPGDALDASDSLTAEGIATTVSMLLAQRPQLVCEREGQVSLADQPQRIGIAVSTDLQRAILEQALAELNVTGVSVRTYNRHQGLEYAVTVLWHPLSSIPDIDPFYGDIGRLCVGISRHRHAAIVVGRTGLRRLLEDPPLSPEAPWPGRRDRFLAGWLAHAQFVTYLDGIGATVPAQIR